MRMLFIALGAFIVLGGGAAGAYFYFQKPAEASAPADEKADKHAKEDKVSHSAFAEFIELDPLILPIVDQNGVSQTVSLVVVLEVPSSAAKIKVEYMVPKLKDAFIQDLYGTLSKHAALKGGVLQVNYLKERLNKVSSKIAGDNVDGVLLQVVQQRPI